MAAKAFVPVEAFPCAHRFRGHGRRLQGHDLATCGTIHPVTIGVATMRDRVPGAGPLVRAWEVPVTRAGDVEPTRMLQPFVKQGLLPYKYPRVIDDMTEGPRRAPGRSTGRR